MQLAVNGSRMPTLQDLIVEAFSDDFLNCSTGRTRVPTDTTNCVEIQQVLTWIELKIVSDSQGLLLLYGTCSLQIYIPGTANSANSSDLYTSVPESEEIQQFL